MSDTASFFKHQRIGLLPLDARPVCYELPTQLADMAGLTLVMPTPNVLGHLKTPADETALFRWIKHHLTERMPLILALDTVAYGGLISSRVGHESFTEIRSRVDRLFETVSADGVYGFSSILRIPAYDNAEEEPDYWAQYGRMLYDYSYTAHENPQALIAFESKIPADVVNDFLSRRTRNFDVNQSCLERVVSGQLDYLAFCQDDTGAFGINVQEALALEQQIQFKQLADKAHVQTGADEVAACFLARLVSRWSLDAGNDPIKMFVRYSDPLASETRAKFDGIPICQVVERAIKTCHAEVVTSEQDADITLWVHTPSKDSEQGDHCEAPWNHPDAQSISTQEQRDAVVQGIKSAGKKQHPVMLIDVAYANGGDAELVRALLADNQAGNLAEILYAYSAWNTPGNAIGTGVAMGILRLLAERNGTFDVDAFKLALLTRFADDWLYEAEVRKQVRQTYPPTEVLPKEAEVLLNELMSPELERLKQCLGMPDIQALASFPCQRTFEVALALTPATSNQQVQV